MYNFFFTKRRQTFAKVSSKPQLALFATPILVSRVEVFFLFFADGVSRACADVGHGGYVIYAL